MCKWVKAAFCIGFFVSLVYSGIMFGMPYYKYLIFKSDVHDMLHFEQLYNADRIKAAILKKAAELNVPLTDENLSVLGDRENFIISANWTEQVVLFRGYFKRTLNFSFETTGR